MNNDSSSGLNESSKSPQERQARATRATPTAATADDSSDTTIHIRREEAEQKSNARGTNANNASSLDRDYATIAQLMKDLDMQVTQFSANMSGMVDSVPTMDGLTGLWEGLSHESTFAINTSRQSTMQQHEEGTRESQQMDMDDEAQDGNDSLVW